MAGTAFVRETGIKQASPCHLDPYLGAKVVSKPQAFLFPPSVSSLHPHTPSLTIGS